MQDREEDDDYWESRGDVELDDSGKHLRRIRCNDLRVAGRQLCVSFSGSGVADNVDWKREGAAIARNRNLNAIYIENSADEDEGKDCANIENFFKAVARNRCIKQLIINGCPIDPGEMFDILAPLFEENRNLRCIELIEDEEAPDDTGDLTINCIVSALSKCDINSLRRIKYHCGSKIQDRSAEKLVRSLYTHRNLREIELCLNECDGRNWMVELGQLLQHPATNITSLDLSDSDLGDDGARTVGEFLAGSNLAQLFLAEADGISAAGWKAFARGLSNPSCPLVVLSITGCEIDDEGAAAIATALGSNRTLKDLDFGSNQTVTSVGWKRFFDHLADSDTALHSLHLDSILIDNEGVIALVNALGDNLAILQIRHNEAITLRGLEAISELIQRDDCELQGLDLDLRNDESVLLFATALSSNTSLTNVNFGDGFPLPEGEHDFRARISENGWVAIANALCDKSSPSSVFGSNHTLEGISFTHVPDHITSLLRLNEKGDKFEVARQKLLRYYFLEDGEVRAEDEFLGMDLSVLPHAIEWIGRDGSGIPLVHIGFPLMHKVVRSLPSLFEFANRNANKNGGVKRKRQFLM